MRSVIKREKGRLLLYFLKVVHFSFMLPCAGDWGETLKKGFLCTGTPIWNSFTGQVAFSRGKNFRAGQCPASPGHIKQGKALFKYWISRGDILRTKMVPYVTQKPYKTTKFWFFVKVNPWSLVFFNLSILYFVSGAKNVSKFDCSCFTEHLMWQLDGSFSSFFETATGPGAVFGQI